MICGMLGNVRDSLIAFFDGISSRTGDMPFTKMHRATAAHFKHGSATLICVLLSVLFFSFFGRNVQWLNE